MQTKKLKGTIYILLATVIWGSTFVAQSSVELSPFTFQGIRSIVGTLFLLALSFVLDFTAKKKGTYVKPDKKQVKTLIVGGTVCGIVLFGAMNLQQFGIFYGTEAGKAGFITAMYMLVVPVLGLFLKKKVPINVLLGIAMAVVGLFLLCMSEGTQSFVKGDIYVMLCAVVFAVHIMVVDYVVPMVDGVKLSLVQFVVAGIISCVCMFVFEEPKISEINLAWGEILYAGIGSTGIAYTLQIVGQKYTPPTLASLVMSFESVFAMLSEVVVFILVPTFGGGRLSLPNEKEIAGCVIMFAAIMLAQLPEKKMIDVRRDSIE